MEQDKIGRFIAELRKERNMTQEQFAEILGVNSRSISRWENGRCMPDLSLVLTIADELDVSVAELLNGEKKIEEAIMEDRNTINEIIDYSRAENKNKARKLNKYFVLGLICLVIVILNRQFDILSYVFQKNAADFVAGALTSLGLLFEFIGLYNINNEVSLRDKKKALRSKLF